MLSEAQQTIDDVIVINHGRLVRQAPLAELGGSLEDALLRGDGMTRLLKGELHKLLTTRTLLAYALAGAAMSVLNVVIVTRRLRATSTRWARSRRRSRACRSCCGCSASSAPPASIATAPRLRRR